MFRRDSFAVVLPSWVSATRKTVFRLLSGVPSLWRKSLNWNQCHRVVLVAVLVVVDVVVVA